MKSKELQKTREALFFLRIPLPRGAEKVLTLTGLGIVIVFIMMALFPFIIAPYDPLQTNTPFALAPPSVGHLMGTDYLGRDIFSRVVYGARTAMTIAAMSVVVSLSLGVFLGLVSGYFGGKIDRSITFFMDALYAFPAMILAIAIVTMLGPSLFNMAVAISTFYIPTYQRVIRGETLMVMAKSYVEAAKAVGARDATILLQYVLPNVISPVISIASLNVADAVQATASLGFLGLGIPPPTPDWGTDLNVGFPFLPTGTWWLMIFPGLMTLLITLGFNLLGEGLNEVFSPELTIR